MIDTAKVDAIVAKWDRDPHYVIEMLQDVQDEFRHLPEDALRHLSDSVEVPLRQIYHLATFFKAFSLEPKGEHVVQVCMGTACHVRGGERVLEAFERELGVARGKTTADQQYTVEDVRCVGCCSLAPVVQIDDQIHGDVNAGDVPRLLEKIGEAPGADAEEESSSYETAQTEMYRTRIEPGTLDEVAAEERERLAGYKGMLMVCAGTGCVAAKAFDIEEELEKELREQGLDGQYLVVPTGCNGFCAMGPIVVLQPEGVFYQKLNKVAVKRIVEQHLIGGEPVARYLHKVPGSKTPIPLQRDIPFFAKQELIALRNKGLIDPENIDSYIARGGYGALRKAVTTMTPEEVHDEVRRAALRGRGGGGFPTAVKWDSAKKACTDGQGPYVVCNADEGDPGAFMDRSIIETDPHAVIEGMLLGAYALGASEGLIYIRKEYPLALQRLRRALDQAREYGLLGDRIMDSALRFEIQIHQGAGAFVCGESSALMQSMQGKPGEPRAKYVHSTERGYLDQPTVLNNVETWANVPPIVDKGGAWFASIGTGGNLAEDPWSGSSGTKVFSLVGDINNTGLVEVPMGITLREIIEDVGGGIPRGRAFKAVQTGGPSGGCLPASMLDQPVDFDTLTAAGSMMGSGGMIVMDEHTCMVDVARYFIDFLKDESCGKCTPCREGLTVMSEILHRICRGEGRQSDLDVLEDICTAQEDGCLCQLGATAPNPVRSTLRFFRDEYEAHIRDGRCPGGVCKDLITFTINDDCTGCVLCAKRCPTECISGVKKQLHVIDQEGCIQCGTCYDVCRFDAITIE